jgi:PHD/YefM family antitoxin component YafN of YafNO toxin-antitoxin module
MKVVTLQQLESDFDAILEDVADNKEYYRIQTEQGDFMLVPYDEYEVLKDTYQEWVDEPQIDPFPLPVEYVGDAEPEKI